MNMIPVDSSASNWVFCKYRVSTSHEVSEQLKQNFPRNVTNYFKPIEYRQINKNLLNYKFSARLGFIKKNLCSLFYRL